MKYDEYRKTVIAGVKEVIKNEPWYDGVCSDSILSLFQSKVPVSEAIDIVTEDTRFFDDPNILNGD